MVGTYTRFSLLNEKCSVLELITVSLFSYMLLPMMELLQS